MKDSYVGINPLERAEQAERRGMTKGTYRNPQGGV
jgi:hypothetical protein